MKLLVPGGAGFIGSAVVRHIIRNTHDSVVNLDKLTYAGNPDSLADLNERIRLARRGGGGRGRRSGTGSRGRRRLRGGDGGDEWSGTWFFSGIQMW